MATYIALLRAINVGGTGKLPMADLIKICETAGFCDARTYIASGNVLFESDQSAKATRTLLEAKLEAYAGKEITVFIRTPAELSDVLARNPFSAQSGSQVAVWFVDALPKDYLLGIGGQQDEQIQAGKREVYIYYPSGMGRSKLRLPLEKIGTARNINTISRLVEIAAGKT